MNIMEKKYFGFILFAMIIPMSFAYAQTPLADDSDTDIIAIVLENEITIKDKEDLNGMIVSTLIGQFAKDNDIKPTEEEIHDFILMTEKKEKESQLKWAKDRLKLIQELENPSLSNQEREQKKSHLETIESILESSQIAEEEAKTMGEQLRPMKRRMAHKFVMAWKINKVLYEKYGGRIIFQQAGVEPLDAYREFLKEQEKNGAFQIFDKQYEANFWEYFTNDAMHFFYLEEDGSKFINTPWWMMEEPLTP